MKYMERMISTVKYFNVVYGVNNIYYLNSVKIKLYIKQLPKSSLREFSISGGYNYLLKSFSL